MLLLVLFELYGNHADLGMVLTYFSISTGPWHFGSPSGTNHTTQIGDLSAVG